MIPEPKEQETEQPRLVHPKRDATEIEEPKKQIYKAGPQGMILKDGLSIDEWLAIGGQIAGFNDHCSWATGDWLVYAEQRGKWGGAFVAASAITGLSRIQLKRLFTVAVSYPMSDRIEAATWTHHYIALQLATDERARALKRAAMHKITISEFALHVRSLKKVRITKGGETDIRGGAHNKVKCPKCGHRFPIQGNRYDG